MPNRNILYGLFIIVCLCFSACTRGEKFDAQKWLSSDPVDPKRDAMAGDLLDSYKFAGTSYNAMVQLLGKPNYEESGKLYYTLSVKYEKTDPVAGKDLVVRISRDSIIMNAEIKAWKKH